MKFYGVLDQEMAVAGPGSEGTLTSQYFNQLASNGIDATKTWRWVPDSDFTAELGAVMNPYECFGNMDEVGVAMDKFTESF